jgi:putative serine protease PepD
MGHAWVPYRRPWKAAVLGITALALGLVAESAAAQGLREERRIAVAERLERSTVVVEAGGSRGSGFVTGPERHVITNAHLARHARCGRLEVRFASGPERPARIVHLDRRRDLAVLDVRGEVPAPPLPLGDSDAVQVGQTVLAFGSPFGLDGTLTQGIVSARRDHGGIEDLIQTDAPVNPGNSGGPLVDAKGRLVGVNTAIVPSGSGNHGIAFAVPSSAVRHVLAETREQGDRPQRDRARNRQPQAQREDCKPRRCRCRCGCTRC